MGIAAAVFLDQFFKGWITANVKDTAGIDLPLPVRLIYVENRGAAFGILQNMRWMFVALGIAVIIAVCVVIVRENITSPLALAGASLIAAGTAGNMIDRALNGYVVDMFQLTFIDFAIFNIADIALTFGGLITCLYILLLHPKRV